MDCNASVTVGVGDEEWCLHMLCINIKWNKENTNLHYQIQDIYFSLWNDQS